MPWPEMGTPDGLQIWGRRDSEFSLPNECLGSGMEKVLG